MTPAESVREEFCYRLGRVTTEKHSAEVLTKAVVEVAAQLADLVAELRDIKADMQRADEQLFGVNKP
jgi:hypothetical protein